jgi:class 3 adenylate cyclase
MTADDLKELGISSFGHRRRLLAAIAAFGAAVSAAAVTATPRDAPAPAEAERRQLTVMFCDLAGSPALSTRFDPEDLRELIGDYHRAVAETVGRFDGFVAKYMGDGVLIYFGYPQAHEDDAERAVRAVIEAVGQLPAREDLRVRLGVATGLAVVGDLIGAGAAQERGVVGETPNLAARLQALAMPNTLVIAEATRRQVVRESGVVSRYEALRGEALTPFVGREEEIALLLRRWQQARTGEGQVVLLSDEAGIGKSRLVSALHDRLAGGAHTRLRYFCSPHYQESALYPFIAQLERAAGFAREDAVETRLDKLAALLAPTSPPVENMALLADLLSLPPEQRYPPLRLSPQRKKEKTFEALLRQLESLAARQPVLFVGEDLHWIDPSSREFLDRMIERAAGLPVLLVATHRPEFVPPWSGLPQVTTMNLARFDRHAGAAIVEQIAGGIKLQEEVAAEIVERADGVPLFVEELTKAVVEAGNFGDRIEKTLAGALPPSVAVPSTLHAPLIARLDRLGPGPKEVAQIAAAIGREFSYRLLAPIGPRRERSRCGARPSRGCRPRFLPRRAARRDLPVQTCPRPRCGLCEPVAPPPGGTSCADCHGARKRLSRHRRCAARAPRPTLHRGGTYRSGGRLLAARRRACGRTIGQCRSGRAFRPGSQGPRNAA